MLVRSMAEGESGWSRSIVKSLRRTKLFMEAGGVLSKAVSISESEEDCRMVGDSIDQSSQSHAWVSRSANKSTVDISRVNSKWLRNKAGYLHHGETCLYEQRSNLWWKISWMSQSRFLLELQHGGRRTKSQPLWWGSLKVHSYVDNGIEGGWEVG